MSLQVRIFGSGSTGNCIFVSGGNTKILIDQGLSVSYTASCLDAMGVNAADVSLLITHSHTDHISGVESFARRFGNDVYCSVKTLPALRQKCGRISDNIKSFLSGDFYVGDLTVSPFAVSHDVPCVGYSIFHAGRKVTVATDLGTINTDTVNTISDSDLIVLESNHDGDMVLGNSRYPVYLKRRILSDKGHLSTPGPAPPPAEFAKSGVKQVVLAHLSEENNYPELAFETAKKRIEEFGFYEGRDIKIDVAEKRKMSALYTIA